MVLLSLRNTSSLSSVLSFLKHHVDYNIIAGLNEELVQLLLMRDELHVEQDAMLVDIEDLTRWGEKNMFLSVFKREQTKHLYYSCIIFFVVVVPGMHTAISGTKRRKQPRNKNKKSVCTPFKPPIPHCDFHGVGVTTLYPCCLLLESQMQHLV